VVRAQWLQAPRVLPRGHAHQHLFDDAAIERVGRGHRLKRRQRDFAGCCPYARPLNGDLPTAEDDFAPRRARPAGRSIGLVRIPRAADRGPILFEHRGEDFQSRSQRHFQQLRLRVDEQIDEWEMTQRGFSLGNSGGYARLRLHGGSFSVRLLASG